MDEYPIIKPLKTKGKLKPVPNIGINLYRAREILRPTPPNVSSGPDA